MPEPSPDARAVLRPREERRLLRGHAWAYRNEFAELPTIEDGALVRVVSDRGRPVGVGYYQSSGGIAVRLLTTGDSGIESGFIVGRVSTALRLRNRLFPGETVYRWIHGESDGLPGLVADRYGSLIVVQADSPFYEAREEELVEAFLDHDGMDGVLFQRGDAWHRFGAADTPVDARIHDLSFSVDPKTGQKTGLFLDQRVNWALLEPFAAGARVLDGHCYVGAWSLHAGQYGAKEVLGVDTSRWAIDQARANADRNGLGERCTFAHGDIQDVLKRGEKYDVVILDPPALAKHRKHMKKALGLYQAMNRDAMKALSSGGVLITSSCSQALDAAAFVDILKRASNAAQRQFQVLDIRGAAPDHPVLLSMPETRYLTCAVLRMT